MTSVDEDKYVLENIANDNQIRADVFISFTITRFRRAEAARGAILTVWLRNIGCTNEEKWTQESARKGILPVQERVVTEFAVYLFLTTLR